MAKKKSQEEIDIHVLQSNMREVLKTSAGKEILWYVLGLCTIYGYIAPGDDHMLGRRSIGLDILQLIEDTDLTAYPKLLLYFQRIAGGKTDEQPIEINDSND